MSENKITKRDYFTAIRKVFENYQFDTVEDGITADDILGFIDHELELLARRSTRSSTPTKAQKEAVEIKARILDVLNDTGVGMTIAEIVATDAVYFNEFSKVMIYNRLIFNLYKLCITPLIKFSYI